MKYLDISDNNIQHVNLGPVRTLNHWIPKLSKTDYKIECSNFVLSTLKDNKVICHGPGSISINRDGSITFKIYAEMICDHNTLTSIFVLGMDKIHRTCSLTAMEFSGERWTCYIMNINDTLNSSSRWILEGTLLQIVSLQERSWVSRDKSVEVVLPRKVRIPTTKTMTGRYSIDGKDLCLTHYDGSHTVAILDTELEFTNSPYDDVVLISARTSQKLNYPDAEQIIIEPLRILLGQLIFPSLIARNMGDGRTLIFIRSNLAPQRPTRIGLIPDQYSEKWGQFWDYYSYLLRLIVYTSPCEQESHPITRFYEEIIQAIGSNWILSLTMCSSAEGLSKWLYNPTLKNQRRSRSTQDIINLMATWTDDFILRKNTLESVCNQHINTDKHFEQLVNSGTIEKTHVKTWKDVRNKLSHGELVSPYHEEDLHQKMAILLDLVHAITLGIIRKYCLCERK